MCLRKTRIASVISSQPDCTQPKLAKNPVCSANDIGNQRGRMLKIKLYFR